MNKKDAINLFGGKAVYLARAIEITEAAMSAWPDQLDRPRIDRVIGAAVRKGIIKGCRLPECVREEIEK